MKYILPKDVGKILETVSKQGYKIYAVGGGIRDMILDKKTKDWDFTTNAFPTDILKIFPEGFYDNKFGTVGIPVSDDKKVSSVYEITTFRSEIGYSDHRHPDKIIWGSSLEEDLKRRDFTINALAFDGKNITDLFSGIKDIQNRIIKTVGNAEERFHEDALRMLRAIRLAAQLKFTIDKNTFEAIKINAPLLNTVSGERVREELLKILSSEYPADGIRLLRSSSLLIVILPELEKCFKIDQKSPKRHHKYDVGTHLLLSLEKCPSKNPIVRLATLLHDVGKAVTYKKTEEGIITFYNHEIIGSSIIRNIANRLKFSKKDREKFVLLVRFHQFPVNENQTDAAIRRFIRNVSPENVNDMLDLRTGDRLGGGAKETSWRLELFKKRLLEVQKQPFGLNDIKINGLDVMKIYNIQSGPFVGAVLKIIFDDVVKGVVKNDRKTLLERLKQLKEESKFNS